jgi:prepilin-type N-terminal cleavage/methylation domain-containing protein
MNSKQTNKGFTIIEVVLVLAIAGLIFLMVFIALPALQRNQRDQARKSEVGTIASAITSFQSNNRGKVPAADATFAKYIDATANASGVITMPSGTTLTKVAKPAAASATTSAAITAATTDNAVFVIGAKCDVDNKVFTGTARQAAVIVQLESGNGYFCQTV